MSNDPAVEAAIRALPDNSFDPEFDGYSATAIAATREALKPIRGLHRPVKRYAHPDSGLDCLECSKPWPCATACLIYPEAEL